MQVSINHLAEETEKDYRTIKKRVSTLKRDSSGNYRASEALEAIYIGEVKGPDGVFIPTPEAVRQLTIAKKAEIDLSMEIKRGLRIPIDDAAAVTNQVFQGIAGILKANRDKPLTEKHINEVLSSMRDACTKICASPNGGSV